MVEYSIENGKIPLISPEEFRVMKGNYPHRKILLKSMDPVRDSKVEIFGECIIGTIRTSEKNIHRKKRISFGFYIEGNHLLLLETEPVLDNILKKIPSESYQKERANFFLLLLLEALIEDDIRYLLKVEQELEALEETILQDISETFYQEVVRYRKELSRLHSYYEQLINIGDLMQENICQPLNSEEDARWQHYTNRTERLHNQVEMLREYLIQIREIYQSQIDIRQNRVMSFLTIVTTIFFPLTLIAEWYGMNFRGMPELSWKYGYLFVIILSVVIVAAEIYYFKKKENVVKMGRI